MTPLRQIVLGRGREYFLSSSCSRPAPALAVAFLLWYALAWRYRPRPGNDDPAGTPGTPLLVGRSSQYLGVLPALRGAQCREDRRLLILAGAAAQKREESSVPSSPLASGNANAARAPGA